MILTRPDYDIFESVVGVEVFEDYVMKTNEFFPMGAAIASEFQLTYYICTFELGDFAISESR